MSLAALQTYCIASSPRRISPPGKRLAPCRGPTRPRHLLTRAAAVSRAGFTASSWEIEAAETVSSAAACVDGQHCLGHRSAVHGNHPIRGDILFACGDKLHPAL